MSILNPLRDPQDVPPITHCGRCGGEVYNGEQIFFSNEKWICPDCFRSEIEELLRSNPVFLADTLLMEHREV